MNCFELTAVLGCYTNGDNKQTVAVHYTHDEQGQPAVRYLDNVGAVVIGADDTNVTLGECQIAATAATQYVVTGGGINIAGTDRSNTAEFIGAVQSWDSGSAPNDLHSITVAARGVIDSFPYMAADQILLHMPDGSVLSMMNGETRTFSVERGADYSLVREYKVEAYGMAYANITYTFF